MERHKEAAGATRANVFGDAKPAVFPRIKSARPSEWPLIIASRQIDAINNDVQAFQDIAKHMSEEFTAATVASQGALNAMQESVARRLDDLGAPSARNGTATAESESWGKTCSTGRSRGYGGCQGTLLPTQASTIRSCASVHAPLPSLLREICAFTFAFSWRH